MITFLEVPVVTDTITVCASLPARRAQGLNRAAELLRERNPGADDATILDMLILHGIVSVIDGENSYRYPRNARDDETVAALEAEL